MRRPQVYLPEIDAYIEYLKANHPAVRPVDSATLPEQEPFNPDVVWHFMGANTKREAPCVVHEYNSLSAGRLPHLKNWLKTRINCLPDRRVFLSARVKEDFGFTDRVPDNLRDMGVAAQFYQVKPAPIYDFVYAGSIHRGREVIQLIDRFKDGMRGASIYIVGTVSDEIRARYKDRPNIVFAGRVPYAEVPAHMAKGRYGLNLVPDRYPFNIQTATKVLEYCAIGMPVVSMRYTWAENFVKENDAAFFWLNNDFSNMKLRDLEGHDFKVPDVTAYKWPNIIRASGIFDFL